MKFFEKVKNGLKSFWQRIKPRKDSSQNWFQVICIWIYKLRSVFLAIPVGVVAVLLALDNAVRLPTSVALTLPKLSASGALMLEEMFVSRTVAVMGPLAITALCLLLMFCSRRVVYPWVISVFSLILPVFLYFTSVFPG